MEMGNLLFHVDS